MSRLRTLLGVAEVTALVLMSPAAYAVTKVTFGSSIAEVPTAAWLLTFVLSTLAGVGALLNRVRDELRTSGTLRWPALFVGSHMCGSWIAGLLVFFIGISAAWSEAVMAGAIISASFMGAVAIERIAVVWLRTRLGVDLSKPMPLDAASRHESHFETTQQLPPIVAPPAAAPPRARRRAPPPPAARPPQRPEFTSDFTPLDE